MSKNMLLTGGTGLLGSYLGYEFLKRGDHVIYLARQQRTSSPEERVIKLLKKIDPDYSRLPGTFEVVEGDVAKPHLGKSRQFWVDKKGTVDEVWHSAAVLHFRDTYEEITEAININGTVNVLNTAHDLDIKRFHHISTAYVSGKSPGKVMESQIKHEYDFRNPYERTKYDAEHEVLKKSKQYGFNTTIYRPSVIVGDSETGKTLSFTGFYNIAKIMALIKRVILRGVKTDPEKYRKNQIYLDGEKLYFPLKFPCAIDSTVNLVPIDYVVDTILKLADTDQSIGQVFHIANPNPPRIVELLQEGCKMVHLEGIEFVECSFTDAINLIRREINDYARLGLNISFCLEIREYIHYLFGEPHFDLSNVRETLKTSFKEPPLITPDFLRMLINYAIGCQWRSQIQ
jgi:nucleoside-diphosphate-sugar epimerase